MHVFYTPDIQTSTELPEEEAQHCVRAVSYTHLLKGLVLYVE